LLKELRGLPVLDVAEKREDLETELEYLDLVIAPKMAPPSAALNSALSRAAMRQQPARNRIR
jgi:hypothetical protein